jgi:hypothetical protein
MTYKTISTKIIISFSKLTLLVLSLILFTNCNNTKNKQSIELKYVQTDTLISETDNCIVITNPTSKNINIQFQINDKFWFTKEQIIEGVNNTSANTLPGLNPEISKAWIFIMDIPIPKKNQLLSYDFIKFIWRGTLQSQKQLLMSNLEYARI